MGDSTSGDFVQNDEFFSSFDAPDTLYESADDSSFCVTDRIINDLNNELSFSASDDESPHEIDNEWSTSLDANDDKDVCVNGSFTKKEENLSFSHQNEYDMNTFVEEEIDDDRELSLSGDIAPTITSDFD